MTREQQYDQINNEGGEGYNPYRGQRRESTEPEWSKVSGKIGRILRIMEGTSTSDPRYSELTAELDTLRARYNAIKPQ